MKYIVRGETMAYIDLIIHAENVEEAVKKVSSGVSLFETDYNDENKFSGATSNPATIHFSGDVEWTDIEEY